MSRTRSLARPREYEYRKEIHAKRAAAKQAETHLAGLTQDVMSAPVQNSAPPRKRGRNTKSRQEAATEVGLSHDTAAVIPPECRAGLLLHGWQSLDDPSCRRQAAVPQNIGGRDGRGIVTGFPLVRRSLTRRSIADDAPVAIRHADVAKFETLFIRQLRARHRISVDDKPRFVNFRQNTFP